MAQTMKPHIVLIPGAGHKGDCYALVVQLLEAEGYSVSARTLPSVGAEPPVISLEPELAHIRNTVIPILDQGRNVVIVMHSYGGVPGTSALTGLAHKHRVADGKSAGVTGLVYVCARLLPVGKSSYDYGGGQPASNSLNMQVTDGRVKWQDPVFAFYNDLPQDVADQHASKLTHHSLAVLQAPMTDAAYHHIPATYLFCTQDNAIPYAQQLQMIKDSDCAVEGVVCDAGHAPFYSQPELTARVIRRAAGEEMVISYSLARPVSPVNCSWV